MAGELTEQEIPLTPTEQVVNRLHDVLIGRGMNPEVAADEIRASLLVRAPAVRLSEEFWAWLRG